MCDTKKIEIVHKIYCAVFNVNAQLRNEDLSLSNLGIFKNLAYGACLGLVISFIFNLILITVIDGYSYSDEFSKTFDGGAVTAIAIALLAVWIKDEKELYNMNLWHGLLAIGILGFAGLITPIFVLGAFAMLFGALGLMDIYNAIAEDLVGGFCMGGMSVGIVAGIWNHIQSPFE